MTDQEWRFCKKCLIRELNEGELFESVKQYVASIDSSIRTKDDEYEERLKKCTECDRLINGTCAVCGCYVEMRAAVKKNACPAVHPKW